MKEFAMYIDRNAGRRLHQAVRRMITLGEMHPYILRRVIDPAAGVYVDRETATREAQQYAEDEGIFGILDRKLQPAFQPTQAGEWPNFEVALNHREVVALAEAVREHTYLYSLGVEDRTILERETIRVGMKDTLHVLKGFAEAGGFDFAELREETQEINRLNQELRQLG